MFTQNMQIKFLKEITGRGSLGLINYMYLGLLTEFKVTERIEYDPVTGEPIQTGEMLYSFAEPHEVYEDPETHEIVEGDSSYIRKYICDFNSPRQSPLTDPVCTFDPVTGTVTCETHNYSDICFNEAEKDWQKPVTHIGIFKTADLNSKDLLMYAKLDNPVMVLKQSVPMFKTNAFKITTN